MSTGTGLYVGDLYIREGGTWQEAGLIEGGPGPTGPTGPTGPVGPSSLGLSYAARAYRAGAFTVSTGSAWTAIPVDTISHDASGCIATNNGWYTCPVAGVYDVAVNLYINTPGTTYVNQAVGIFLNGSVVSMFNIDVAMSSYGGLSHSDKIKCNAGDHLQLAAFISSAPQALLINGACNFLSVSLASGGGPTGPAGPAGGPAGPTGPTGPAGPPATVLAARAYRQAAFTTTASWTKVPLDTASFDVQGNMLNLVNGRIVCPVAGIYAVDANLLVPTSATGTYTNIAVGINKNGSQIAQNYSTPAIANFGSATISDKVQCNAGDYLELFVIDSQGGALWQGSPANYLSVALLTAGQGPTGPAGPAGGPIGPTGPTGPTGPPATVTVTAARAYRNAAFTLPAGAWTKIPLDTANYDVANNMLNLVNGRLVCPTTGLYDVAAMAQLNMPGTATQVTMGAAIYKNGGVVTESASIVTMSGYATAVVSDKIQCNAGDYLELWAYNQQGLGVGAYTMTTFLAAALITAGAGPPGPPGPPGGVQPAMRMTLANSMAIALNVATMLAFDTPGWAQGGMIRSPNGGFIVPVAGVYQVICNMLWNTDIATGRVDYMIVNYTQQGLAGGDVSSAFGGGGIFAHVNGQYQSSSFSGLVQANAGDVLGVVLMNRAGAGTIYGVGNWTMAHCVRVSS